MIQLNNVKNNFRNLNISRLQITLMSRCRCNVCMPGSFTSGVRVKPLRNSGNDVGLLAKVARAIQGALVTVRRYDNRRDAEPSGGQRHEA